MVIGLLDSKICPMDKHCILPLLDLKNGDEKAFVAVYRTFHTALYAYAMSFLKSKEMAEEIVQDVFLTIWLCREDIDLSKSFRSYLFTIARNRVFNALKKTASDQNLRQQLYSVQRPYVSDTDRLLLESEMTIIHQKAMQKLPPKRRRIFIMSLMEGKSYHEISEELGISLQTVKNQMSHALKTITSYLKTEGLTIVIYLTLLTGLL